MGVSQCNFLFLFIIAGLFLLSSLSAADAQQIEVSSSLNPVGSGARATGMGGAFIGVADDATAASWNPAGLIQLERPEISAVYSYFHREQGYNSSSHPEVEGDNSMDSDGLNYASIVYPFALFQRNMVVSLNYQRLYEMNKEVSFMFTRDVSGDTLFEDIDFTQDGYLYALSPAFAVQVTPSLYIGATVNIWDNALGENGWDNEYRLVSTGRLSGFPVEFNLIQKQEVSFKGTNAHIGVMWDINGSLTVGGVYKTAFNADLEREISFFQSQDWPTISFHDESFIEGTSNFILRMPPSYGIGISYRYSDNLTVAFDVYRTEWSKFVLRDESESESNPVTGAPISSGRLKDTTQVRLGTEYLFIQEKYVVPVRFGLFYDPEPETGSLDDYYGFSLGTGFAKENFAIDAAYQYRTADDITGDIPGVSGITADIDQHLLMVSGIIYF